MWNKQNAPEDVHADNTMWLVQKHVLVEQIKNANTVHQTEELESTDDLQDDN